MLKTGIWWLNASLSLVWNLRKGTVSKLRAQSEELGDAYVYKRVHQWAKNRLLFAGVKVEVKGIENIPPQYLAREMNDLPQPKPNALFVSNHQSNFDILTILGYLPCDVGFIAKTELAQFKTFAYWMREIHCLFLDRNDMKQSMQTIVDGVKAIKNGQAMVVFPEGTRSKGKAHHEFKAGSLKLATKANAPIIPLTVDGAYKAMEGNPHGFIRKANVTLTIHEPIYTEGMSKEEQIALPARLEEIIFKDVKEND